ncbi:hypothetical protein RHGRI_025889 [Rhododendron griersonianum]|uniref:Uncharacterized protein n=1 Tax=Rhododendron griersonianum TaxID=479676 RepID=A0AAV6IS08_9ERIC|nr:hypothetical protein RHGRI_025889 [Rhododendron griersonianum]
MPSWKPHEKILTALEGTCFYNLALLHSYPHPLKHNIPLLQAIANSYNRDDRVFDFGGHRSLFGLEDVLYMTGLPIDGEAVSGVDGNYVADVRFLKCKSRGNPQVFKWESSSSPCNMAESEDSAESDLLDGLLLQVCADDLSTQVKDSTQRSGPPWTRVLIQCTRALG